jgi:hypothetical protein
VNDCPQPLGPSWDDLHPPMPRPVSQGEAIHHFNTKAAIRAMQRNILGVMILRALGMRLPLPPTPKGQVITPAMVAETNRRLAEIRAEQAEQGRTITGREESKPEIQQLPSKVEELRDSVTRSEAQTNFEAQMRAKEIRRGLEP